LLRPGKPQAGERRKPLHESRGLRLRVGHAQQRQNPANKAPPSPGLIPLRGGFGPAGGGTDGAGPRVPSRPRRGRRQGLPAGRMAGGRRSVDAGCAWRSHCGPTWVYASPTNEPAREGRVRPRGADGAAPSNAPEPSVPSLVGFLLSPSRWVDARSAASARPPPTEGMYLCWRWGRGPRGDGRCDDGGSGR
jgi:hypothetical protein